MAGLCYCVLEEGGQWKVRFQDKEFPYPSREAALSAALETAQKISLIEDAVQVLLRSDDGKWQVIWASRPGNGREDPSDQFLNGLAAFGAFIPFAT